jgi:dTDP-4-amino-4,6-dideoxygalactose transaminase
MIPIARPQMGEEEKELVWSALASGQLAQGERVREFEERFAAFVGVRHAVATSSGTTALHLAMLGLGIGPGDEVITVSFTFIASASSIVHAGARPVFVDIDPETYTMDASQIEAAITPSTRAIMPVSLYGQLADMPAILEIAERHGLSVIEDASQSHGAELDGRPSGAWGIGEFSFYATKNMTTAEGGAVTTDDSGLADRVRLLREHGMKIRYQHEVLGYNFRMTDVHASIGLAQLAKLPAANERRQAIAARYSAELVGVVTPNTRSGGTHVFHQYVIRVPDRDEFADRLRKRGVGASIHYPIPVHRQAPFVAMGHGEVPLPVTERFSDEVLSLPVHPSLSDDEVDTVIGATNATARELGPIQTANV